MANIEPFDWGAGDTARRENIAKGHQRIREKIGQNLPTRRGPDWEWHGQRQAQGQAAGGGQARPSEAPSEPTEQPTEEPAQRQSKLGAMFRNPGVRGKVDQISKDWTRSNLIRQGGMHEAIRAAFKLEPRPSHKDDWTRARMNTNSNAGMNPGHYEAEI